MKLRIKGKGYENNDGKMNKFGKILKITDP